MFFFYDKIYMFGSDKMYLEIDGHVLDIIITRKPHQKNTYLRIKNDLKLYVNTSRFTTDREINKIINENYDSIVNMYRKQKNKYDISQEFYYLGKVYDIIKTNSKDVVFGESKLYVPSNLDINKWLKKQATIIFKERLDFWYNNFTYEIPYPTLTIRKMTSRWGVCNSKLKRVTLNLELIKKDIACLDYVICHELSHFIEMNHSSEFWRVVGENYPNYKEIRRIMKNY